MSNKHEEKAHLDALIKSLPLNASTRTKQSLNVAMMRYEMAWQRDQNADHLVAEIERLVQSTLPKKREAPLAPVSNTATEIEKILPPEPTPLPPVPSRDIPDTFTNWTFIPISTTDKISIGAPVMFNSSRQSVIGEIHDNYLLDGDEKFERTPLLINGLLIDAGDWAATYDALDFVKSFAPEYAPFVKNVFLARLTLLTKMETTTRKTVNDFRRNRAAVVSRWTTAMTLFLQGVETGLAGNDELLAHARAMVNRLALSRLFDPKNGHITFHAIKCTDEKIAAECRLIKILTKETRATSTADDLSLLRTLRANLRLPASVCEDVDAHVVKLARMTDNALPKTIRTKKQLAPKLIIAITEDPLYLAVMGRANKSPAALENDPDAIHSRLSKLNEFCLTENTDGIVRELTAFDLSPTTAKKLAKELAMSPETVAQRLQDALGKNGRIGPVFAARVHNAMKQIRHSRLRFALLAFTRSAIKHFADSPARYKHVEERFLSTSAHFHAADELIGQFTKHLPFRHDDFRSYLFCTAAQDKVIADRLTAGFARYDQTTALPAKLGRYLLSRLTPEEKSCVNAAAWFKEMFAVNSGTWQMILDKYALPNMECASDKIQETFQQCRDRVVGANIWKIISNECGFPFAVEAIKSLEQRARFGKVEILHGLCTAGLKAAPLCAEIRDDVCHIFFQVEGTLDLPSTVSDLQINNIVSKIIHRCVAPRHWSIWVTKRAEILLRADEIIHNTGRLADRKKILLAVSAVPAHRVETLIEKFPSHQ